MKKMKRILAAVLAIVMLCTCMVPIGALAADLPAMDLSCAEVSWDFQLGDEGGVYRAAYGLSAGDNPYGYEIAPMVRSMHDFTAKRPGLVGDNTVWEYGKDYVYCFCIEHGVPLPDSGNYSASDDSNHGNKYAQLSVAQKDLLTLALTYGYPNRYDTETGWQANACYAATQLIVWQITLGFRTSPTQLNDKTYPVSGYSGTMTEQYTRYTLLKTYYDRILSDMAKHSTRPSFTSNVPSAAKTFEMEYKNGEYTLTLTDSNHVLESFVVTADGGVSVSKSGNTLTLSSPKPLNEAVTIKLNRQIPGTDFTTGFLIWSVRGNESGNQDMVSGVPVDNDPVPAYFKVQTSTGSLKLVKTSEDGVVSNVSFTVTGNGITENVKTDSNGEIKLDDLRPGKYIVTEQTGDRYEPQESKEVTIVSGQTATITFNNVLKRGSLRVTKTSEDGLTRGVKFHLYGTSDGGLKVDEYAVTDASGIARFENVLIGTGYILEEVDIAERYVVPDGQTVTIEWNRVTDKSFNNVLKKWRATVIKTDRETGTAQGDASLAGAVYGVYQGERLIDTYTTDANGAFTTAYYLCGDDWSVREITPSEGYLLDNTAYPIGAKPELYTAEYNTIKSAVTEQVIKGKVSILKHTDNGETKIETPEEGATFEIYRKAAGNYDAAKETERDILVCDENGYAETKALPYGVYTVKQTQGWEGRELMSAFDVFVSENGKIYRFLINNENFKSHIKVVKVDAETGKTIPYAGVGFQIYDPSGELVTMRCTYPALTTIDTFYTNDEGYLITPEALAYGKDYSLVEVTAPYGYVLNTDPVYFDVTAENAKQENALTVIQVEKQNMSQKGRITVTKSSEVFSSVVSAGGIYQPVYEVSSLKGAVYSVTAAENIYTPDGMLRYRVGAIVDTITTGADGTATTKPLYLGKYEIKETTAPYGYVLSDETITAELDYAGQEIELTRTTVNFYNERQKIMLDLTKSLEQNAVFGIGGNDEILSVSFGLYAAEDIVAADGKVIPKDGLIEIVFCNENGKAAFTTDLPVGAKLYVKEISTDEHYVLTETKYPVVFEYAGQDTASIHISVDGGKEIVNELIHGTIKGLKIDREREKPIAGALFGLFRADETDHTAETAILTDESDEDGVFTFENIPFGNWVVRELEPAGGYLPNSESYAVEVSEDEQIIEISVINDRIPEIGTKATVGGKRVITATGEITIEDVVSYKHLIPGKVYVVKGVLMDKSTGKEFLVNGNPVCSVVVFTPETPDGEITVTFTFDTTALTTATEVVVFETLYREGVEIAVHADIADEDQTVKITLPAPTNPRTGDTGNLGFWIGLAAIALGGVVSIGIVQLKSKKGEDE